MHGNRNWSGRGLHRCSWLRRHSRGGRWLRRSAGLRLGRRGDRWFRSCSRLRGRCRSRRWLRCLRGQRRRVRSPGRRLRRVCRFGHCGGLWLLRWCGRRRCYISGGRHRLCLTGSRRDRWLGGFLPARHQGNQNQAENSQRTQPDSRVHADVCSVIQRKSPQVNIPIGFKVVPFYYGEAGAHGFLSPAKPGSGRAVRR